MRLCTTTKKEELRIKEGGMRNRQTLTAVRLFRWWLAPTCPL